MDAEIHRLVESINGSGFLSLNIDLPSFDCRQLFDEIYNVDKWEEVYALEIRGVELPMEGFTYNEEESFFNKISKLPNLQFMTLCGGRHAKDGSRLRGGLMAMPNDLLLSTSITTLDLSFNLLEEVPSCLQSLFNLKILMLDFNNIEVLTFDFLKTDCNIIEVHVRNNKIVRLDESIQSLSKLEVLHLSSNKLVKLPNIFQFTKSLLEIDISNNSIELLPVSLFQSFSLKKLNAGLNQLSELPNDVISSNLELIDVRYNHIENVQDEIANDCRVLLDGNTPLNDSGMLDINECDVITKYLSSDVAEIEIGSSKGVAYVLPSGVRILVPTNFSCDVDRIYCNVISKEPTEFKLRLTDQLLSVILELTPNGLNFSKPLRVSLPYHYSACDVQSREIVMRATSFLSDDTISYEDLQSEIVKAEDDDSLRFSGYISAFVDHFTMFAVVSRLVENRIQLHSNVSSSLFSTVDHFTRLYFPENVTSSPTDVVISTLSISQVEVESIVGDSSYCPVGNVLQVTVTPRDTVFTYPVTVHLALPDALIGCPFDHSMLRLLKAGSDSDNWVDITDVVNPVVSTVDVSFQVDSFSRFWLVWKNMKGVARKVYQRAITYKVQFIAMQKKVLPTIVIAQCVRADLAEVRVSQLRKFGFSGDDACSEIHELMEGDKFKIQIIGDIRTKTNNDELKKHLEEKSLVRCFHSQYPPEKCGFKFCIESVLPSSKTAIGYVSFHKVFEKFLNSPESKSSCQDSNTLAIGDKTSPKRQSNIFSTELGYLDDILITLESSDTKVDLPESICHPLHFGEYGKGMFQEITLRSIASQIGAEWEELGHYLGIRTDDMERIKLDHPNQSKQQIFAMLLKWSRLHMNDENCVTEFTEALKMADRTDLAENVLKIYENGVEKFKSNIKKAKGLPQPEGF